MSRLILALVTTLALAACATTPPRVKVETVEVKVPVRVPCVQNPPKEPVYLFGRGMWPGFSMALVVLISDLEAAQQYARDWEAAAAGCEKPADGA